MKPRRPYNASTFDDIGEPTLVSSAELRAVHSNCVKRLNQNSFYVTIDIRQPVTIFWQHNTGVHFHQPNMTFSDFIGLIHPHWRSISRRLTLAGYEIAHEISKNGLSENCSYSGYLPVRQLDNSYSWYKQFLFPGTFDKNGKMVHHHHECLRLGPFNGLRPFSPNFAIRGVIDKNYSHEMKLAGGEAIKKELKLILTSSSYRNLEAYRMNTELVNGNWIPPSSSKMQRLLSLNQQALNKANTRILRAARVAFPNCTLGSVGGFSVFMNEMFGRPDE